MLNKRDIINQAISTGSVVWIVYRDYHGRVTERDITPLEWVTYDRIRALCHLRGNERDFRIDRIVECEAVGAQKERGTHSRSRGSTANGTRKSATPRPVARKVKRAGARKEPTKSQKGRTGRCFTKVRTADQWSRLVKYYAECLVRENYQQYVIQNKREARFFFPAKPAAVREFLEGRAFLEFPSGRPSRPTSVARFVNRDMDRRGQQLCLGYPIFVMSDKEIAPLIFAPVKAEESNGKLRLQTEYPEPSYAVFRSLGLTGEEIEAVLAECATVQPQRSQSEVEAWEAFLIGRLSEIMGSTLRRQSWDGNGPISFEPGTLCDAPCLFWVKDSIATANLIKELRELSASDKWDSTPKALKELLGSVPEKDYPDAPMLEEDSSIYVSEINKQQRQAIAAAQGGRVTVVTGPPGTGKSQMVLNLVAQAVLHDQSVLFASRNNKAVDVVMDRLKNEIRFSGAVRTGNRTNRQRAVTDMVAALDQISATGTPSSAASLREGYFELKKQVAEAEETLHRVRELEGLLESHQAEQHDLITLLPKPVAQVAQSYSPEYRQEEVEHLQAVISSLLRTTLKAREEAAQVEAEVLRVVGENSLHIPLLDLLEGFEDQWGSFGGGFLRPRRFDSLEAIRIYVQTWLSLLPAFDVQSRIAQLVRLYRKLGSSCLQHQTDLPAELEDQVNAAQSRFETRDLTSLAAKAKHLAKRAAAIAHGNIPLWEKLLIWLRLKDPALEVVKQFVSLRNSLGLDWTTSTSPRSPKLVRLATVCHQLTTFLIVCLLQSHMNDTRKALENERQRLGEITADLPPALRDDISRVELSDMDSDVLKEPMKSILAHINALIDRRDQLAARINSKLDMNDDVLQTLDAFKATPASKDKRLWVLRIPTKLQVIISHLTKWRNLVSLWETNEAIRHLQRQREILPPEDNAVARVRELQEKQLRLGADAIRSRWLERVKGLGTPTLQKARYYVSAVQQLSGSYDRSRYGDLKSSEEMNFPGALEIFPVWATTNLAAKSNLPLSSGLFDVVVIDEASQCDIPSALPLLYRAKHIVIIGDPNQLKHVATLYKDSDLEAAARFGVAPDAFLYNTHSLFDIAQRSVGAHPGTVWLRKHYRSDAQVIGFSNEEFYDNRLVLCTDVERRGVPPDFLKTGCGAFWVHVDGTAKHPPGGSAFNLAELRVLQKLVPRLLESLNHYQTDDFRFNLGIVTPYREQANRIQSWISQRHGNNQILVGTAHTFQGDERDVVIFSPVLAPGLAKGSLNWLSRTENLLNVAITRPRLTLIVLGQWDYCHALPPSNKYRRLADYIEGRLQRMVREIDSLPILGGEPFDPVGTLLDPRRPEHNRTTLRRLIASCREFVWWVDPYLQNHVIDLFWDVFQHPQVDIHDVRLLTSIKQAKATESSKPRFNKDRARALQSELRRRGVSFEIRFLPKRELPHDRFFYSLRQSINMPPFGGAYGDHKHVSEYTWSTTEPAFFEQYWDRAVKM